jgi:hypothetical protein
MDSKQGNGIGDWNRLIIVAVDDLFLGIRTTILIDKIGISQFLPCQLGPLIETSGSIVDICGSKCF